MRPICHFPGYHNTLHLSINRNEPYTVNRKNLYDNLVNKDSFGSRQRELLKSKPIKWYITHTRGRPAAWSRGRTPGKALIKQGETEVLSAVWSIWSKGHANTLTCVRYIFACERIFQGKNLGKSSVNLCKCSIVLLNLACLWLSFVFLWLDSSFFHMPNKRMSTS